MKTEILLAVLILMTASAAAFQTSLEKTSEDDQSIQFELEIGNDAEEPRSYQLFILSPKSNWFYYPQSVEADSSKNGTAQIQISIPENTVQRTYGFTLKIRESDTEDSKELVESFQVNQPYTTNIIKLDKDTDELLPGENIKTDIEIKNLENSIIQDYSVEAEYREEKKTKTGTEILPGGTRRFSFEFKTPEDSPPSKEKITYSVKVKGQTDRTAEQTFNIKERKSIKRNQTQQNKILWATKTASATNNGNTPQEVALSLETPSYLGPITETETKAEVEEKNGTEVYTWQKTLQPGESYSKSIKTSYWKPAGLIAVIIAAVVAIKKLGKPLKINKTAEKQGDKIKIKLEIANTGNTSLKDVEIEEFIPDIATVDKVFEMNTPETRKTSQGTQIKWEIDELEPSDQRIIQYQIKPKVDVEEKVELKPATAKQEGEKIAESNSTNTEFTP
jgi:hypothetical protein